MRHEKSLKLRKSTFDYLNKALQWTEEDEPKNRFNELDGWIGCTIFSDEYQVDVEVWGVPYPASNGNAYAIARLLKNDKVIASSNPSTVLLGQWELKDGDEEYVVTVECE